MRIQPNERHDMTTLPEPRDYSATYLRKMLALRFPDHYMSFVDLFALGCLLHARGERCAGHRLVFQVLAAVGGTLENSYLAALLDNLSGNEIRFVRDIEPDMEVTRLCERGSHTEREAACAR